MGHQRRSAVAESTVMTTPEEPSTQLSRNEVTRLRQRVAELEHQIEQRARVDQHAPTTEAHLTSILDALDDVVWSQSATTFDVIYLNEAVERIFGHAVGDFLDDGELWLRMIHPEDQQLVETYLPSIVANGFDEAEYRVVLPTGDIRWIHDRGRLMCDGDGQPLRIDGIATDITERKRALAEREVRRQQEELIRSQTALLHELSTPLIPISDSVLVMPLIGAIDSLRAQQVVETLLDGITSSGAQVAIIDITGVPVVDTQVAHGLLRAAQAATLVGAQIILTGIRPEVAQTLVQLGVSLGNIVTHSTLQHGIAYALRTQRR